MSEKNLCGCGCASVEKEEVKEVKTTVGCGCGSEEPEKVKVEKVVASCGCSSQFEKTEEKKEIIRSFGDAHYGIIGFAIIAYVVMDGFDLGIGILFPFFRVGKDRDTAMNSIAP